MSILLFYVNFFLFLYLLIPALLFIFFSTFYYSFSLFILIVFNS